MAPSVQVLELIHQDKIRQDKEEMWDHNQNTQLNQMKKSRLSRSLKQRKQTSQANLKIRLKQHSQGAVHVAQYFDVKVNLK